MSRQIQNIPIQLRPNTGAMQFDNDWPGLFIRGDECISLLHFLEKAIEEHPERAFYSNAEEIVEEIRNNVLLRGEK